MVNKKWEVNAITNISVRLYETNSYQYLYLMRFGKKKGIKTIQYVWKYKNSDFVGITFG